MSSSTIETMIEILGERLNELLADYRAANRQISNMLDDVQRQRMQRQIDGIENQIIAVDNRVKKLRREASRAGQAPSASEEEVEPPAIRTEPLQDDAHQISEHMDVLRENLNELEEQIRRLGDVPRAQIQLLLPGKVGDFDEERRETLLGVLSAVLQVARTDIAILKVVESSIRVLVEVPRDALERLRSLSWIDEFQLARRGVRAISGDEIGVLNVGGPGWWLFTLTQWLRTQRMGLPRFAWTAIPLLLIAACIVSTTVGDPSLWHRVIGLFATDTPTPTFTPTPTPTPTFTPAPTPTPKLRSFQDFEEKNGTPEGEGNYFWNEWYTTCSFSEQPLPVYKGTRAIRVEAFAKAKGTPEVDSGGTIGINPSTEGSLDLSYSLIISVWVYDTNGNNNVELKLRDDKGKASNKVWSTIRSVKDQWAPITWHLSDFVGVDKKRIKNIELYEWNDGVYFFDEVTYSSWPYIVEHQPIQFGIFAETDQAEIASRAYRFQQFHQDTARIASALVSDGSEDDLGYEIAYSGIAAQERYACWGIVFPETDVSGLSSLAFDIKGQRGGEIPNVWLTSSGPSGSVRNFVDIENYVRVNDLWQRVEIPLVDFHKPTPAEMGERDAGEAKEEQQTIDLKHIGEVQLCFEWGVMEGTIFVDGFAFERSAEPVTPPIAKPIPVAPPPSSGSFQNFEQDNGTPPGAGNYFWDAWYTTCSFSEPPLPVHTGQRAVRVEAYAKQKGDPQRDTGGAMGINPSSARPIDLSSATTISVWVYDTQGNNTVQLKLRDWGESVSNARWSEKASVKDQWALITWDLAGFEGVDKRRIKNIELYEWNDGVYLFDDVRYK